MSDRCVGRVDDSNIRGSDGGGGDSSSNDTVLDKSFYFYLWAH